MPSIAAKTINFDPKNLPPTKRGVHAHPYTRVEESKRLVLGEILDGLTNEEIELGQKCYYAISDLCQKSKKAEHDMFCGSINLGSLKSLGHKHCTGWLTDEIITYAMKHHTEMFELSPLAPSCIYLTSYFTKLITDISGNGDKTTRTPQNSFMGEFDAKEEIRNCMN